jgi:hypothetical protein
MVRPLIYDRGFLGNIIGDVDNKIKQLIISQLNSEYIFVNTTWIEDEQKLRNILNIDKIAVCYSGPDWENTQCVDIRRKAHEIILKNSKSVIHIGNTRGQNYFNFWAEFIRQNPTGFFNNVYIEEPNFNKLFMCLNRKPHSHRLFLINLLEDKNIIDDGYVSIHRDSNPLILEENLSNLVTLGDQSVVDSIPINNDIVTLGDPKYWNSHFLNIVTETTVHTDVFISEKTWKPIIGLRPFLILGDYNIYNQLHEIGIDTFDDLFGKWYTDTNWETRAESIVDIINSYKTENIDIIYKSIKHRLENNRKCFLDYANKNIERLKNEIPLK